MLHCSPDVKVKAIGQHCIVFSCGMIIKCLHLVKFVSHLTMLIEKYKIFWSPQAE